MNQSTLKLLRGEAEKEPYVNPDEIDLDSEDDSEEARNFYQGTLKPRGGEVKPN